MSRRALLLGAGQLAWLREHVAAFEALEAKAAAAGMVPAPPAHDPEEERCRQAVRILRQAAAELRANKGSERP